LSLAAVCRLSFFASPRWLFGALAKITLLFTAGASIGAIACGLAMRGKTRLGLAMVLLWSSGLVCAWVAAGQDLQHLPAFISRALLMSQGYNQAMAWEAKVTVKWAGFASTLFASAAVIISSAAAFRAREKHLVWRRGILSIWLCSLMFILWKYGMVRADLYHLEVLEGFMPVLALGAGSLGG